jgi:oxygen-independent coproporphyrinogen III oxidase
MTRKENWMDASTCQLSPAAIEQLATVLGQAARVSYAPPNIYPMSAPTFAPESGSERKRPAGNELGLYIHIPYCNYSCSFCFYATRLTPPPEQMRRYLDALRRELAWVEPGSRLTQLYVGGGTPTTLPPELLGELLTSVFDRMTPRGGDVHTVETSPESITPQHIEALQAHGIERVSMGIQSLSEEVLGTVKRRHAAGQALDACDLLVQSGLLVNVDLIYGLPGQTEESFCRDFAAIVERGIHSVTAYNLRVNERTPVGREIQEPERLDLAPLIRWRARIQTTARELGFEPIRWHTFRRRGPHATAADAAHRFTDVTGQGNQFGIGISARSRLEGTVYRNHSSYDVYLDRIERGESPVEATKELSETERKLRFVALTLGDGKSLDCAQYRQEFGCDFGDDFGEAAEKLQAAGLIQNQGEAVVMTPTGQLVYDLVTRAFYPNPVRRWLDERQQLAQTAANLRAKPRAHAI